MTASDTLISEFTEGAISWGSLVGQDAQSANRIFDQLHEIAKNLRETAVGRTGLADLTGHEAEAVRLLSSTECLAWDPNVAVPALEAIASAVGLHAISAKYTLRSFREGTLNLDW